LPLKTGDFIASTESSKGKIAHIVIFRVYPFKPQRAHMLMQICAFNAKRSRGGRHVPAAILQGGKKTAEAVCLLPVKEYSISLDLLGKNID
jgi:hypothetical protein